MDFWSLFILFFFPFLGGVMGIVIRKDNQSYLKLFLAFSGAFLLAITALNLIPETYETIGHDAGYFVLVGFFLQVVIDFFSRGIEHGHLHVEDVGQGFPLSIFLALSFHALLEGLGLGSDIFSEHIQDNLLFGIALHEIPAAFALVVILKSSQKSENKTHLIFWIALYAMMVPLGVMFGSQFGSQFDQKYIFYLMGIIIGVFLHISTTILFENTENHKYGAIKLIAICLGLGLALLVNHGH